MKESNRLTLINKSWSGPASLIWARLQCTRLCTWQSFICRTCTAEHRAAASDVWATPGSKRPHELSELQIFLIVLFLTLRAGRRCDAFPRSLASCCGSASWMQVAQGYTACVCYWKSFIRAAMCPDVSMASADVSTRTRVVEPVRGSPEERVSPLTASVW